MNATNTSFEIPKLTEEEREEWAATRAKGQNRFLLVPGLPIALGATLAPVVDQVWRFGFSLDTFKSSSFILEVCITFYGVYAVACFKQLLWWRKYEYLFLMKDAGNNDDAPQTSLGAGDAA